MYASSDGSVPDVNQRKQDTEPNFGAEPRHVRVKTLLCQDSSEMSRNNGKNFIPEHLEGASSQKNRHSEI